METFNLHLWLDLIQEKLKTTFADNLLFIGYHGSYRRQEAAEDSDIDLVVILKDLAIEDLKKYREIVNSMPFKEKCCGFISGEKEIQNWSKSDIFQFYYETENLYGDIKKLITQPAKEDIQTAVKTGCETLYHALCHSFLFDKNKAESLSSLYKMTFFILQATYFLKTNRYILTKKELLKHLDYEDSLILETCINRNSIKNYNTKELEESYNRLLEWCKGYK